MNPHASNSSPPSLSTAIADDATATAAAADINPQFTVISDEDQALLDSFFAGPESLADDYSNLFGSGMASQTYGLAPEIVSGEIKRLPLPGIGQPGYSSQAVSSYGAVSLSCSLGYLEEPFRSRFVALSPAMMNAGFSCGRCVRLQCDDTSCAEPGKQLVAQVVDRGGELFDGDMTLSGALFTELTGRDIGRNPSISVSWAFESCSSWIDTPVKMLVKPGMYSITDTCRSIMSLAQSLARCACSLLYIQVARLTTRRSASQTPASRSLP